MQKKKPSISFFFSSIKYFEDLIFRSIKHFEPHIRICYLFSLKDRCQKEIDKLMMVGNRRKIFKYLDNIENRNVYKEDSI